MAGEIVIDTRDLRRFASKLRVAAPASRLNLDRKLKTAGKKVADEYKSRAFTSKGRTRVSTARGSVTVVVTGPTIVHLEEIDAGSWEHPTFGHDPVVTQESHPALAPALDDKGPEALADMIVALDEVFDEVARL